VSGEREKVRESESGPEITTRRERRVRGFQITLPLFSPPLLSLSPTLREKWWGNEGKKSGSIRGVTLHFFLHRERERGGD